MWNLGIEDAGHRYNFWEKEVTVMFDKDIY